MHKSLLGSFLFLLLYLTATATDDVLFTVGDTPVKKSEFEYIYKKNNFNNKADYSRKSLQDYLNLYVNFRLKVKEALSQKLDKTDRFKEELSGYEQQLLNSYVDKEVIDKLIKQEFERSKTDVAISHIFIPKNEMTESEAIAKLNTYLNRINSGENFEDIAKTSSKDLKSAPDGGYLGWFNSYQINLPEIEEAVYSMQDDEIAKPIKTDIGYHLIKRVDSRPALPKIRVAMIKKFFPVTDTSAFAKMRTLDSMQLVYSQLVSGKSFDNMVEKYSEDELTKGNNGILDWFGINTYNKTFEQTAYALKDGEFSKPFQTKTAVYIIKRLETAKTQTYDEAVLILKTKLPNTAQFQYALDNFISKQEQLMNATEYTANFPAFKQRIIQLSSVLPFIYRDTIPVNPMLKMGTKTYTESDYGKRIQDNFYTVTTKPGADRFDALLKNTTQGIVLDSFKNNIKINNNDYKMLMDEYKNGIMIFALSEKNIWNKASEDSAGLLNYYTTHQQEFKSRKKANIRTITLNTSKQAKSIYKAIRKDRGISNDMLEAKLKQMGLDKNAIKNTTEEAGKSKYDLVATTLNKPAKQTDGKYIITQIGDIQPEKQLAFDECRGYVVAAYQEQLEKDWVAQLRAKYPVQIDQTIFDGMVKK